MATIVLGVVGRVVGGAIAGPFGAAVGGIIGAVAGSTLDQKLFAPDAPDAGKAPRLKSADIMGSTEGSPIPRQYGRARITGEVIWATRFEEVVVEQEVGEQGGGKGGGGQRDDGQTIEKSVYYGNFAVAFCEGPIRHIGRIWFDGKEVDQTRITFRVYYGRENQEADSLIAAKEGSGNAPAYRGVAYIVFEHLRLTRYGDRLPQVSAEIFRTVGDLEGMIRGVALIPGASEFGYDPDLIKERVGGNRKRPVNRHTQLADTDIEASIDALKRLAPNCSAVTLVVAWFGDDLRCGNCQIRPKVESQTKVTTPHVWRVAGDLRGVTQVVSEVEGKPAYGGSPSDASIIRAIEYLTSRGYEVTLYPFVMMDVPDGNDKPNPYSDNAGEDGQPAYPWRGRITCSPAPGYAGSPDKTSAAKDQVEDFLGTAQPSDFGGAGAILTYSGPDQWRYRRFILHMAKLCDLAGGVHSFVIGSEMAALTTVREDANTYPFVRGLRDLAGDVRTILGGDTQIGYAADWSEYHSHRPGDGSGDVFFHLDPLWADDDIDFVGIDNYFPLADWRDGTDHLDYDAIDGPTLPHELDYLTANVEGGEGFDWFYASLADRDAQNRTAIVDSAEGKHWVFRQKDLRNWWANAHHNRPGGVENPGTTNWMPEGKPIWFTEVGCPAVDKGANQPNVFFDGKSAESAVPYYSSGARDDAMQRAYLEAVIGYWQDSANNPTSSQYDGRMVRGERMFVWAWDVRPSPAFPDDEGTWADARNWHLGHWISGRLGLAPGRETIETILREAGFEDAIVNTVPSVVDGVTADKTLTPRAVIEAAAVVHAVDGVESAGRLVFTARAARGVVATIDLGDMVIDNDDQRSVEGATRTRAQETELPASVRIGYGDPAIDDQPAVAIAIRSGGGSARVLDLAAPVTMASVVAEAAVDRALFEAWLARESISFTLPPSWLRLDPGDTVRVVDRDPGEEYRLTLASGSGALSLSGERTEAGLYLAPAARPRREKRPKPDDSESDPVLVLLDGPMLRDDDVEYRGHVGATRAPWRSGVALYRAPTTSGYVLASAIGSRAIIGVTTSDLYSGPVWRWDRVNSLYLVIDRGMLASASQTAVLNGANALAIENADGEWEVLQFATATLNGTLNYILTDLLRGQRGTEHAMRSPVASGARVMLLSGAVQQPAIAEAEVGLTLSWRYGPADLPIDDEAYAAGTFAFTGRGRRPYAPARLRGRRDHATGDWTLSWIRRTRIGGDSWEGVDVPLAEATESYRLEILDAPGGSVLRTVTLGVPEFVYTAAMQAADHGAPVWNVAMRVTQLSAIYGAGIPAETLTYHY